MRPIWTVCLDEILRAVASERIDEKTYEDVIKILNMFSKKGVEVMVNMVREILQDEEYASSFQSVHLSVSRGAFVVREYNSFLKECVKEESFNRDKPELLNIV